MRIQQRHLRKQRQNDEKIEINTNNQRIVIGKAELESIMKLQLESNLYLEKARKYMAE